MKNKGKVEINCEVEKKFCQQKLKFKKCSVHLYLAHLSPYFAYNYSCQFVNQHLKCLDDLQSFRLSTHTGLCMQGKMFLHLLPTC